MTTPNGYRPRRRRLRTPLYYRLSTADRRTADRWENVLADSTSGPVAVDYAAAELQRIYGAARERAERVAYVPVEEVA